MIKAKPNDSEDEEDDEENFEFQKGSGKIGLRIATWNLEGSEETLTPDQVLPLCFPGERTIKAFALVEVKQLEKLRELLWSCVGGKSEFELFEHWMGRPASLTVLLVFAPKELVRTGQFRLSRNQKVVKREILNGTRFKFGLGGTTSSRGAVSIPFTFIDTSLSICSLKLVEEDDGSMTSLEAQQRDLDRILEVSKEETPPHHVFVAGSFACDATSTNTNISSNNSKSSSKRKSFFSSSSKSSSAGTSTQYNLLDIRKRLPALNRFEEINSEESMYDADHVFFQSATKTLREACLLPISSKYVSVTSKMTALTTLFTLVGRGNELLSLYARMTGNLPLHLSSRSHFQNTVVKNKSKAQRPKLSSSHDIRKLVRKEEEDKAFILPCTRCALPISNSDVQVPVTNDGSAYHLSCFTCDHCQQVLKEKFHEVDGKLYCPQSFQQLFVNNCASCQGALGEEFLVLPGPRRFHVSCYRCSVCFRPFATKTAATGDMVIEAAIPFEDGYLCELDFASKTQVHVTCCACGDNFVRVVHVGDDAYCMEDFSKEFDPVCAVCNVFIAEDDFVLSLQQQPPLQPRCCHLSCLQCTVCKRYIEHEENGSFVEFNQAFYCVRDWELRKKQQQQL